MNNTLTLNSPFSISQPIILRWRFSLKTIWISVLILVGALSIFYIFQVNTVVREIYLIKSYEKQFFQLSQENQKLSINFSKANSLENIEALAKNLGFEKVGKIHYIKVLGETIVTK